MNVECKKCNEYYCTVCKAVCPKCGELDVQDEKTMKLRERMQKYNKKYLADEEAKKAVKPARGVMVGGITGASWVNEMTSFLKIMKKERGTFICRAGNYARLNPIMGVKGNESRPYSNLEIEKLLSEKSFNKHLGYFEDKGLLPVEKMDM